MHEEASDIVVAICTYKHNSIALGINSLFGAAFDAKEKNEVARKDS